MKYFFLFAHPEPELSYQAALLASGRAALEQAGHEVQVSNLYQMGFNPVASGADFPTRRFPDRLQYDREQKGAAAADQLADDVKAELAKVFWCDVFVMQFPLYWYSMPAIMKGWIDRVFVNSVVYGAGKRYESGGLKGRRAMVCTSTGAYEPMFRPDGLLGDMDRALWPIHNGILFYAGFEVLPPFVAWSPTHSQAATTEGYLSAYGERLLAAADTKPMAFHPTTDFDSDFRLKEGIAPRSAGHWRP
jgi:NAD(P)H dehydrogenase (quinone)